MVDIEDNVTKCIKCNSEVIKDEDTFVVEEKKVFVTEDDDCC